jgi:hypothetical protein
MNSRVKMLNGIKSTMNDIIRVRVVK